METPQKRDLLSIEDLSRAEILALFEHADRFGEDLSAWAEVCRGKIMATLFFEPSTRTRLSFESAMLRLGGGVITAADSENSSRAKGESLADTVRVVGGRYADILVVRHPEDGAARIAARYARVPVINGGDGAHEHPTQTLCDLYTLWKEKGRITGLDVLLCGDLRYSRTIHSFAFALARFGANIVTMPYQGFEMPPEVMHRLGRDYGVQASAADVGDLPGLADSRNAAAYLTASKPHQLALFTNLTQRTVDRIDAVYMTRAQRERHDGESTANYPRLSGASMRASALRDARVMHPLPRVDEIDYELDQDPRSIYFRQAELGVPMRMALMAFQLGCIKIDAAPPVRGLSAEAGIPAVPGGVWCTNDRCVVHGEGRRYLAPDLRLRDETPPVLACAYCDREMPALFLGDVQTRYFASMADPAFKVPKARRVWFTNLAQAESAGFSPAPDDVPGDRAAGDQGKP